MESFTLTTDMMRYDTVHLIIQKLHNETSDQLENEFDRTLKLNFNLSVMRFLMGCTSSKKRNKLVSQLMSTLVGMQNLKDILLYAGWDGKTIYDERDIISYNTRNDAYGIIFKIYHKWSIKRTQENRNIK